MEVATDAAGECVVEVEADGVQQYGEVRRGPADAGCTGREVHLKNLLIKNNRRLYFSNQTRVFRNGQKLTYLGGFVQNMIIRNVKVDHCAFLFSLLQMVVSKSHPLSSNIRSNIF